MTSLATPHGPGWQRAGGHGWTGRQADSLVRGKEGEEGRKERNPEIREEERVRRE